MKKQERLQTLLEFLSSLASVRLYFRVEPQGDRKGRPYYTRPHPPIRV